MVNNTLPAGQLVVALIGGQIAQKLGGFQNAFVIFGLVGLVVVSVMSLVAFQKGLFRPRVRVS